MGFKGNFATADGTRGVHRADDASRSPANGDKEGRKGRKGEAAPGGAASPQKPPASSARVSGPMGRV